MRTPLMAGNWKMYKTPAEGAAFVRELIEAVGQPSGVEALVCPPAVALATVAEAAKGSPIMVGGQNLYPMAEGAYTGETSPAMLKDMGMSHVILGHSERRQYFHESDAFINAKIKAALEFGLIPIVCVGESLDERERKMTFDKIGYQLEEAFKDIPFGDAAKLVVAYEPIWAIGTGRTATPEQAQDVHAFIRKKLEMRYGQEVSEAIRIQYGGSVKPDNVDTLMSMKDIDGALVGGASLKVDSFARIVNFTQA